SRDCNCWTATTRGAAVKQSRSTEGMRYSVCRFATYPGVAGKTCMVDCLASHGITRMPLHAESCTYPYRHWNITGDAQPLCGALCREATKEANSTEESTQGVDQSGFHWVKIVVPVHMPGKPRNRRLEDV